MVSAILATVISPSPVDMQVSDMRRNRAWIWLWTPSSTSMPARAFASTERSSRLSSGMSPCVLITACVRSEKAPTVADAWADSALSLSSWHMDTTEFLRGTCADVVMTSCAMAAFRAPRSCDGEFFTMA
eukprot:2397020-Pyramimonas_sp.AAC.1